MEIGGVQELGMEFAWFAGWDLASRGLEAASSFDNLRRPPRRWIPYLQSASFALHDFFRWLSLWSEQLSIDHPDEIHTFVAIHFQPHFFNSKAFSVGVGYWVRTAQHVSTVSVRHFQLTLLYPTSPIDFCTRA